VTGIDDNSRFVVSAMLVARATARPVCEALVEALGRHGVPEQILTDNGKVFTGRFGPGGTSSEVLFDRVCAENGIRHLLTAPRSPTTTGKVERLHKTMRIEFLTPADRRYATIEELQQALDAWVIEYNTERPHQSLGMRPPVERFGLVTAPGPVTTVVPASGIGSDPGSGVEHVPGSAANLWLRGVRRWVGGQGQVRLAGFIYRVPVVLAGEPVECLVAENLVQLFHRGVLVGSYPLRRKPAKDGKPRRDTPVRGSARPRRGRRAASVLPGSIPAATLTPTVIRAVDTGGSICFASTTYWVGKRWCGQPVEVSVADGQVFIEIDGQLVKTHPARHDPAKELGAYATPDGHPARRAKKAQQQDQSQPRAV
jgi:hypothetical protein